MGQTRQSPAARLKENDTLASLDVVREFHQALTSRKVGNVRRMVEAHPRILRFVNDYGTVLHHAAAVSTVEIVEYLLGQGFGVDEPHPLVRNGCNDTPLREAVMNRDAAVLRFLVERGANVNVGVLHMAARLNDDDSIRCLLDHGADPSVLDYKGLTPLGVAVKHGCERAAALLKERGAPLKGAMAEVEKPTVSIHLPSFAEPIRHMIEGAVAVYAREHVGELVSALALHADAVTGFVSVCLETGEFDGDVPAMKYAEYETLKIPEWRDAYEKAGKIVLTSDGGKPVAVRPGRTDDAKFDKPIYQMLVNVLKELSAAQAFAKLPRKDDFQIGVEMMEGSYGKFWKMKPTTDRQRKAD